MSNGFSGLGETSAVGELDQRHVGVGAEQLVGGVAVLARVEHRLAVDDRQERLQLAAVPGRPDRRVAQRPGSSSRRAPPTKATASTAQPARSSARPRGRRAAASAAMPTSLGLAAPGNSVSSGRIATSIASGAAIISALAWE